MSIFSRFFKIEDKQAQRRIKSLAELSSVWQFVEKPKGENTHSQVSDLEQLWEDAQHEAVAEEMRQRNWESTVVQRGPLRGMV